MKMGKLMLCTSGLTVTPDCVRMVDAYMMMDIPPLNPRSDISKNMMRNPLRQGRYLTANKRNIIYNREYIRVH